MHPEKLKQFLLVACETYVNERAYRIQEVIGDIEESLKSETKSSAGDKHETGRAMIQLEREKAGQQFAEVQKLQGILNKLSINITSKPNPEASEQQGKSARLGSVVCTSQANYFLSISAGKINFNDKTYFAVSTDSPIGKLLVGKKEGDTFTFNGSIIKITRIF